MGITKLTTGVGLRKIFSVDSVNNTISADLGDSAAIVIGGKNLSKIIPNINCSFKRRIADEFYLNINASDVIVPEIQGAVSSSIKEGPSGLSGAGIDAGEEAQPALSSDGLAISTADREDGYSINDDGTLEYTIRLSQPPAGGKVQLSIQCSPGVQFYHRGELDQWEIDQQCVVPEGIINSYAVYCDRQGNEYGIGKLGHIKRSWVETASGYRQWCEQSITQTDRGWVWEIAIPEEILADENNYPLTIGPALGFDGTPASYGMVNCTYTLATAAFMPNEDGQSVSISVHGSATVGKLCIYDSDPDTGLPTNQLSAPIECTTGDGYTLTVLFSVPLSANKWYWLAYLAGPGANTAWWYDYGAGTMRQYATSPMYGYYMPQPWSDFWVGSYRLAIWVDYTVGFPPNNIPTVDNISPADQAEIPFTTSVQLSGQYHDIDADVGSLVFKDDNGNTIETATNLSDGDYGEVTWGNLSPGQYSFEAIPNDGTENGDSSGLITFVILAPDAPIVDNDNPLPPNGSTRTINTAMKLMIPVSGTGELAVEFYDNSNNYLGSDASLIDAGVAQFLWTNLSPGTEYFWKAKAKDAYGGETTSSAFSFTTRSTVFTIYDYEDGSSRNLGLAFNLNVLGADYHTIAAFLDYAQTRNLVFHMKGEALGIPDGYQHTEDLTSAGGLGVNSGGDSTDYRISIFQEVPSNKSDVHLIQNNLDSNMIGFNVNGYNQILDIQPGITSTADITGVLWPIFLQGHATAVGCLSGSVSAVNAQPGSNIILFGTWSETLFCECAHDARKTISAGSATVIGFFSLATLARAYNCTATRLPVGFGVYGGAFKRINCCSQDNTSSDISMGGGSFDDLTCAIDAGLTIAADGYTLTEEDNQGTDLSQDEIFPVSDDINGIRWIRPWSRSVNNLKVVPPITGWSKGIILGLDYSVLDEAEGVSQSILEEFLGI